MADQLELDERELWGEGHDEATHSGKALPSRITNIRRPRIQGAWLKTGIRLQTAQRKMTTKMAAGNEAPPAARARMQNTMTSWSRT